MRIAHVSDIHFGRIEIPGIVERLVTEINQAGVDVVAVSGDLTQRARRVQYEAAASMLASFQAPTVVVPGNHDVHAWWRPHARILKPLERFKQYVSDDLLPRFEAPGLAMLGINSAHGRTIMGGRIQRAQREDIRGFFSGFGPEAFKVLVVHHHLVRIQALGPHDVARNARFALRAAASVGVDLILCGHLHISHIEPIEVDPGGQRLVVASAGTATSNRGRRSNRKTNFYNLIEVHGGAFTIEERRFSASGDHFVTERITTFERVRPPGEAWDGADEHDPAYVDREC